MRVFVMVWLVVSSSGLAAEPRYWQSLGPPEADLHLTPIVYVARSAAEVRPEATAGARQLDFSRSELVEVGTPPFADGAVVPLPGDGGELSGTVIWFPMFREKHCATPPDGGYQEGDPDDPAARELQWVFFDKWEELLIPGSTPSPINIGVIQVDVPCGTDIDALRKSWRVPDELQTQRIFGYPAQVLRRPEDLNKLAGSVPEELKRVDFIHRADLAVVLSGREDQVLTDWHPVAVPPDRIRPVRTKQYTLERVTYTCSLELKCAGADVCPPVEGPTRTDESALHRLYSLPKTGAFIAVNPQWTMRAAPRAVCEREAKLFVAHSAAEARRFGLSQTANIDFSRYDLAGFGDGPWEGRGLWDAQALVHGSTRQRTIDIEIVDTFERDNGCCGVHHPCDPAGLPTEARRQSTTVNLGILYLLPKSELPMVPRFVLRKQYVCPNKNGFGTSLQQLRH